MSARRLVPLALACALALGVTQARAAAVGRAPLALAAMTAADPPLPLFAQRAIDRTWGVSDDSVYAVVRVPEWKSEGLAAALSAAVPGAGQLYDGENSGYLYLLAEVAGWVSQRVFHHTADTRQRDVERFAGSPGDTTSTWSAIRWANATGGDPSYLERLYAVDRSAYWELLANDDRYLAGWAGGSAATRAEFQGMRDGQQRMLRSARIAAWGLLINHAVSAVDALRAARLHDLPLRQNLELRLKGGWREGGPTMMAVVERSF